MGNHKACELTKPSTSRFGQDRAVDDDGALRRHLLFPPSSHLLPVVASAVAHGVVRQVL